MRYSKSACWGNSNLVLLTRLPCRLGLVAPKGRFSSILDFVSLDLIISGEKFLNQSLAGGEFSYLKRDFFYRSGVWRGERVNSFISDPKLYKSKPLVMGHSDISTRIIDGFVSKKFGATKLFAVNCKRLPGFSEPIPLGITNFCDDSPIHRILGDESHFIQASDVAFNDGSFIPSVYVNFTAGNNKDVRRSVLTIANQISNIYEVVVHLPDFTASGRIQYLRCLRTHGLVLCPEGNGVDTHRFWETLYMGGVPVVTRNPIMETFYSRLPVIQLNAWSELANRSLIEEKWWEITNKSYDFSVLSSSYWIKRFSDL